VGILWASVVLCSPLLAIAAGFAIENLFKNQQFKLAFRTFNPLVDGSNPSWPTNKIIVHTGYMGYRLYRRNG
jgi:hypothetical protein